MCQIPGVGYKFLECAAGYVQAYEGLSTKQVGLLSLADIAQSSGVCCCCKIKPCMHAHQQASYMTTQNWEAFYLTYTTECAHPYGHLTTAKVSIHLLLGAYIYQPCIAINLLHMICHCGLESEDCLTGILALTGFWNLCS